MRNAERDTQAGLVPCRARLSLSVPTAAASMPAHSARSAWMRASTEAASVGSQARAAPEASVSRMARRRTEPLLPTRGAESNSRSVLGPLRMSSMREPRVAILGGGFGGLNAAKALRGGPVQVTLIDRRNHHLFQPLLYQVATAALSPSDIAAPIRRVLRHQKNAEVLLAEATAIDLAAKTIILDKGSVSYDYLIVATGARHS